MRALAVVEVEIPPIEPRASADAVIGAQVDLLVFDRTPQSLDEHVVAPRAAAIHADPDRVAQQQAGERRTGELAALDALLKVKLA